MKITSKIPYFIVGALAWIVIISSCANQGMPTGGPKDSIPPILVGTQPEYKALNFKGKQVRFTFDEYIDPSEISEALVISPPLTKRPIIKTKAKTLIVQFNEDLLDSATYSFDFKNSLVDNNERNPYKGLRFSFSTGDVYDSLRVAGRVLNSFNLEPVENTLVVLHNNLHDSTIYKSRPNYIAKTNETGLFMIDNIAPGKYHLFSINDANSDLIYNEGAEEIAFVDSILVPSAEFHAKPDTLVKGADSLLITGHTRFQPEPFYLRQFTEDIFEQYLDSYKRDTRNRCSFIFSESVEDSFNIQLLNTNAENWYILENNEQMDSLNLWIADTLVSKMDTLLMELSYYQLDSTEQLYVQKDTLELNFKDKEESKPKKKKKPKEGEEEAPAPIPQFTWSSNISNSGFDLNKDIHITAPEPVKFFDSSMVNLFLTEDTLKTPLKIDFKKDTAAWRRYKISFPWESKTSYTLEIDSAACTNIYGITSRQLTKKFTTQEEDYYGTIQLILTNVTCPTIIQILKNNEKEDILYQKTVTEDAKLIFDYLAPEKYKVKAIYDTNNNGIWDAGSNQDKYQPESVAYINQVIKVRSHWDKEFPWDLTPDPTFTKNIRDKELEEQQRKEDQEKARKEKEQEQGQKRQGGTNSFQQGGTSNFRMNRP